MSLVLWVALGGALGAAIRHLVTVGATTLFGEAFPWGTLACNLVGSLAIGWLAASLQHDSAKAFWMIGVLGGFTTFSSFSLQTLRLIEQGAAALALAYVAASVLLCLGGAMLGLAAGRG